MAKHLAMPITISPTGVLAALEQDSPGEIAQSVALLLRTEPGERAASPDYGYPSPLGAGLDPDEIADVVTEWEPRADPALIEVTLDTLVEQHATVHPTYPAADLAAGDTDGEE